jgi:poly-gamma-glutamate synthesis protein (capsule biosynthesis protein)
VDCCVLANNHVLDFGETGLCETLEVLKQAGIRSAGAGRNASEAQSPAVIETTNTGRILVFGFGCASSGIPPEWAAGRDRPGVNLLCDLSTRTVAAIAQSARSARREGDLLVASVHWGGNWGYQISRDEVRFAHELIDVAGFVSSTAIRRIIPRRSTFIVIDRSFMAAAISSTITRGLAGTKNFEAS